ncbi:hypothetical protein FOVG_19127 [Fusarium oxysporum f. sp. pisi HDV247]|uniref:T6SS Phospholipase effector Tle1-like catalytic domain-containing protein n=1 Tax=Fusarium oxysporum f. sp. pisi HDV247 TaxID=1080344 RepID=W9NNG3_FUSOX|nr:hypothetical protein FOVG_19127 [Fusarium oxysporum f. sp. pisi HDV247]
MVGISVDSELAIRNTDTVKARYADGVGLGSTFLHHIFKAADVIQINEECETAYQYIVENYTPQFEIWMFGLSRGAYIVRAVAGMINNCGIIRPTRDRDGNIDRTITTMRCRRVYQIYRSREEWASPQSHDMKDFRTRNSYNIRTPVKFMGLFDTVGSLGIPKPIGGEGFVWPDGFHDKNISSVVEKVYHAVSLHDRLTAFQPCLVNRSVRSRTDPNLEIHQKWFPGTHYDLCRQKFKFFRVGASFLEIVAALPLNLLSGTVQPNTVLSDLVLKWMLESIKHEDPDGLVIPNINNEIQVVIDRIRRGENVGSGDVYDHLLHYIPFGHVFHAAYWFWSYVGLGFLPSFARGITTEHFETFFGINLIKRIFACKDRLVTERKADVYHYRDPDYSLGGLCIRDLAVVNGGRYPSKTYENFLVYQLDMDLIGTEGFAARFEERGSGWTLD